MPEEKKYYTVSSLAKAFAVIELMAREAKWELGKLAEASGLPKGTLQRILLTLVELGYVSRERGQYALTLKLVRLGREIADKNSMLAVAQPFCRKLVRAVNETVNLCMRNGTSVVVLYQEASSHILKLDSAVGSAFPVFPSASGKVLCAFLSELEYLRLMQDVRRQNPDLTQEAVDRFSDDLAVVRRTGMAFDYEEIFTGVRCAAAPVFSYTGDIVACLSCSVPTSRIDEESSARIVRELAATAAGLSHALGAGEKRFAQAPGGLLGGTPIA